MPFLTFVCKNPTPHKTQVFVPAAAMGSASVAGGGGNQGAQVAAGAVGAQAIITCPKCAFTAQPGDGQMSSVANGTGQNGQAGLQQEEAIGNQNEAATDQGVQVAPVLAGTPDSAVRLTVSGGGVGDKSKLLGQGSQQFNLNQAGDKNLL